MNGQDLYRQAKRRIPGGTQLLSKRPELFLPDCWPPYYRQASGSRIEDIDGNWYTDMSMMGVGACILGYADPEVDDAVKAAITAGVQCTLNAPEEVELADLLCELHPWADMVRYTRSGGEAMAMAVRIARAHTGRDKVAFCGYHGWSDWYLAANLGNGDALDDSLIPGLPPAGVPRGLAGTAFPFHYNQIEELEAIVAGHGRELAAIVMEPRRSQEPAPGFLESVRRIADQLGTVLIFDEITTGFRMTAGGIHLLYGVQPDMAVLAKAMANGYAMAAVIGKEPVMDNAQASFISSTNWTERIGPTAALATIRKYRRINAAEHLQAIGQAVMDGWQAAAVKNGLRLHVEGLPSLNHFCLEYDDELTLTTLFTQRMLQRGYLAYSQFKASLSHTEDDVAAYLTAVGEVFAELAEAVDRNDAEKRLQGPPARRGFYRLA
ncbi:MAG TPA: aminotransferase class III-fold pyridoxal phosphate-dependent enzyme [Patescibacteria group bacterium]|nr:aminotransferase class III-fold pyridoxal phosphate-dependent enzyme [Patescibacteria group bacterium]